MLDITLHVAETLDRLDVPYLVGGSLASSLHGIPRATQDVDFVAALLPEHVPALVDALQATFYIDAVMILDAIARRTSFNIIHLETMFKIDVFLPKDDLISEQEMQRRQSYLISEEPRRTLVVASPEDIILQKLYWYQLGAGVSDRQWHDVLGVIKVMQKTLDLDYLQRTASLMNVVDLWQRACTEAGLDDYLPES
ncbi:MAG: hypothetical protein ACE5G0_03030 [Rhodothermales bacterium]